MDNPVGTPAGIVTSRIHARLDDFRADLNKPLPMIPVFLPPDEAIPSAATIDELVQQVERRGLRRANASQITNLYILGRALSHLETPLGHCYLRRSMPQKKVYRFYRMALRCFELYSARGHEYLAVASAITPNVLSAMSCDDFGSLLSFAICLCISELQEQHP